MAFFETSDGEKIEAQASFENSGLQELIPDGTQLNANIESAYWVEPRFNDNELVEVIWIITDIGKYYGYTIKHKIHVFDDKEKKADKAKKMLAAIDKNCKGVIAELDKKGKFKVGDSAQLQRALNGGAALITVAEYEMDDRKGNWVRAVGPCTKKQRQEDKEIIDKAPEPDDFEDDIPF